MGKQIFTTLAWLRVILHLLDGMIKDYKDD